MILPHSRSNLPWAIAIFDIDGVVRDVTHSYRRAIADTVESFTNGAFRPSMEVIDCLKSEGIWNNDWRASEELIYRYFAGQSGESQGPDAPGLNAKPDRTTRPLDYEAIVAFFQSKYRGENFSGYIQDEPILMTAQYIQQLEQAGIGWGFFSGATRGSAEYVLCHRLGLERPLLVAMEDAPSKPDPTGLFLALTQLQTRYSDTGAPKESTWQRIPVFYVGDTVADMATVLQAQEKLPDRPWYGIGVLPPHARGQAEYSLHLQQAGAIDVLEQVLDLTPTKMQALLAA
jgi:HAD superfamily phosphatase